MDALVCKYHSNDGARTCIAYKGRKFVQMITINPDVTIKKVPMEHLRYCRELDDYPLGKACDSMLSVGKVNGITKGAKTLLLKIKSSIKPEEIKKMELAIEKPVVKDVPAKANVPTSLKSGISAKDLEQMIDAGDVTKADAVVYLQQRVDKRESAGKKARAPTLKLLAKLKAE